MAKTKERSVAENLFVDQHFTQKKIAEQLNVSEKTVAKWVKKYQWKKLRDAKLNNYKSRSENIKQVIEELTNMTLSNIEKTKMAEAQGDTEELIKLKKETTRLSQEVGMYQKALEKIDKDFKISLSTYLDIMQDIFEAISHYDKQMYLETLDFQKQHLQHIAQKLG